MNNDNTEIKTGHTVRRYCKVSTQLYNKITMNSKYIFLRYTLYIDPLVVFKDVL